MKVEVTFTKPEVYKVSLVKAFLRRDMYLIYAILTFFTFIVFYEFGFQNLTGICLILFMLMLPFLNMASVYFTVKKRPNCIGPAIYEITEEYFKITTEDGEFKLKNVLVKGVRKTKDYFFIKVENNIEYTIPKRLLSSDEALFLESCYASNN